ncbi:MAG TPA: FecR domain-containing protein [Thermoanaerobaculia bacterium]|nr:FecR domain-containing protein [Thermoanaerobaculia bacterium]
MPPQKANSPRKDWYSVSVDTLRGMGLLVLVVAILGLGFLGYEAWERRALEREAAHVLTEVQGLSQRLQKEEVPGSSFKTELDAAWQSFQEARNAYGRKDFRKALESGRRSRNVLLSILDALQLPESAGQAQFLSIQGEVLYRRGDGGDWKEARSRAALHSGDYVRTSENGSAEIMFLDGTLYTVRPNTQFIVSASRKAGGGEQTIEMEYGWVDMNTAQSTSNVKTPNAVARVLQDSEAFVQVNKGTADGRFGALSGTLEVAAQGGLTRQIQPMQQVVQTGDLLSEPSALPERPDLLEPTDNVDLDLEQVRQVVLAWNPVAGAGRYALQISRNHLFVDNVIDVANRTKTRATVGLRGEGTFQWRVAAFKNGVEGPWSKPRKFRVASFRSGGGEKDTTPPELDLADVKSYGSIFIVGGRSEPGARIEINGEQVKTEADGSFTKTVQLSKDGWSFIEIRARDASGNETLRRHRVFVENP